jgi:molybdopterin molybdotransferase
MTETQRLLSVEDALTRLLAAVESPLPIEAVAPGDALRRILAAPVISEVDLPRWDNSAMDGYAVHAADTAGASPSSPVKLRVVGEVRAGGSGEVAIPAGCAVRIATGAPLPADADGVVPVESTLSPGASGSSAAREPAVAFVPGSPTGDWCDVVAPAGAGDHVRRRGEDVRRGAALLEPGTAMGPAQIALAAGVGRSSVSVHRRPLVGVLATGDELREPGRDLDPAGIPDANRPGLLAACRLAGAEALDLGIARDSVDSVLAAVSPALDRMDALLVSGGVSVGPYDVVRDAFESIGSVDLWRVAVQPGKPFAFGRSNLRGDGRRVLLFGLPGNPVSTLVTFELFVRPVLERLGGRLSWSPTTDRGVTTGAMSKAPGRRGYLRVTVDRGADGSPLRDELGRLRVSPAASQGSHVLSAMAAADALAVVPESVARLGPGEEVEIRWLSR